MGMLCLTRAVGQRIVISGGITITVIQVKASGAVRLGIEAPPDVAVNREEVNRAIERGDEPSGVARKKA